MIYFFKILIPTSMYNMITTKVERLWKKMSYTVFNLVKDYELYSK